MTTGTMWAYIIAYASKYGKNAVRWCYKHKSELLRVGMASCELIHNVFGV
ncbi:MAG: aureocin A53 family class IId bacteriocin [Paraclostridium sordellii]